MHSLSQAGYRPVNADEVYGVLPVHGGELRTDRGRRQRAPSTCDTMVVPRLLVMTTSHALAMSSGVSVRSSASIAASRRARARPGSAPSLGGGVAHPLSCRAKILPTVQQATLPPVLSSAASVPPFARASRLARIESRGRRTPWRPTPVCRSYFCFFASDAI